MKESDILKIKSKIDSHFKKKKMTLLLSVLLENVEDTTIYIRLDYDKNVDAYRLSWCDISKIANKKIIEWVNTCLVYPYIVDKIKEIIAKNDISEDFKDDENINSKVIINSYLTDYEANKKEFVFKRYIPKCWEFLADVLYNIFDILPSYYRMYFKIMVERLIKPSKGYLFAFDYQNDNIDELFEKQIIARGKKYYEEDRILFLEKYNDFIYAVVQGSERYLISIIRNEKSNELQMSCNCECDFFCKHIYAAIMALKEKKEKKFFKIAPIDNKKTMLEKLKNFNYLLCVDIVGDSFVIIDDMEYKFADILFDKKLQFKIIEDDENKTLEKKLKAYLKKKKIKI